MSYKAVIIFTILAFAGLAQSTVTKREEATNTVDFLHFETNEVFNCGGIVTDPKEQILYKPFKSVGANERCVWIVAVPKALSYKVRVLYGENFNSTLNVAGISLFSESLKNPVLSSTFSDVGANFLVITFHTGSAEAANGFALEYEVTSTNGGMSTNSATTIVDADTLFIKFPENRDLYDNYELATFVLSPNNNVHVDGSNRQVIYKRIGLEGCYDKLSIYTLNPETNQYTHLGNICDSVDTELINLDDVGLIVFRSDAVTRKSGFNLAFANCGGN